MMQLLLYQINWPAILDLESVGTEPSSHPILVPFRGKFLCFSSCVLEILESNILRDNFTMALYSFGGVNNQCGVRHGLYKKQECFLFCLAIVT